MLAVTNVLVPLRFSHNPVRLAPQLSWTVCWFWPLCGAVGRSKADMLSDLWSTMARLARRRSPRVALNAVQPNGPMRIGARGLRRGMSYSSRQERIRQLSSDPRVSHRVASEIARRITAGVYARGSRMPSDAKLLEEFPVSRPAIREALVILETLRLVAPLPAGGARVASAPGAERFLTPSVGLADILQACAMLEAQSAALAAVTPRCDRLPLPPRPMAGAADCHRFHIALAGAAMNGALFASIRNLWDAILARDDLREEFNKAIIASHRRIELLQASTIDAIAAGRPEDARVNAVAMFDAYRAGASAASRNSERSWARHDQGPALDLGSS